MNYEKIIVIGSIGKIRSYNLRLDKALYDGDTELSGVPSYSYYGGTGLTIAMTLRKLSSIPIHLWTLIGNDHKEFEDLIRTSGITQVNGNYNSVQTASGRVINFNNGEQQWLEFGESLEGFIPAVDLTSIDGTSSLAVLAPIYYPVFIQAQREVIRAEIPFMYDPGMLVHLLDNEVILEGIEKAKIVIANESEWRLIQERVGITPYDLSLRGTLCIRTLSHKGTELFQDGEVKFFSTYPTESIDATGAGDNWRGAFLASVTSHKTLQQSVEIANAVASISVGHFGAFDFELDPDELNHRLEFIQDNHDNPKLR